MRPRNTVAATLSLVLLASCATQHPLLYRNDTYRTVGEKGADAAIEACEEQAGATMKDSSEAGRAAREAATSTAIGAGAGAAGGAVWGATSGGVGSGAGAGAAGGAAGGLVAWALGRALDARPPDPTYRALVDRCLTERGFEPIAWQ